MQLGRHGPFYPGEGRARDERIAAGPTTDAATVEHIANNAPIARAKPEEFLAELAWINH